MDTYIYNGISQIPISVYHTLASSNPAARKVEKVLDLQLKQIGSRAYMFCHKYRFVIGFL